MLSGITPKAPAITKAQLDAFLKAGGEITKIKPKKVRKHSLRAKAHQMGGMGSRYLSGGTRNLAGRSRKCA